MLSEKRAGIARKLGIFGGNLRKVCLAIVVLVAVAPTTPSHADGVAYVSSTGSGTSCTAAQPCGSINTAVATALNGTGRVVCLNAPTNAETNFNVFSGQNNLAMQIDCPQGVFGEMFLDGANMAVWIRNLTFKSFGGYVVGIRVQGNGFLILENCVLDGFSYSAGSPALTITPNGAFNLIVRNSRISNSIGGVFLQPATGGSIKATFDHVTITGNSGGGIKADSTNGPVNLDITDSEVSNNGGNGINLVGSAGQNMLNLSRSVIAKNGVAGLQANGANAAGLVDTTLFDTNTTGATSVVAGGHVLTYGNNRIVGSAGSGFTGPAAPQ